MVANALSLARGSVAAVGVDFVKARRRHDAVNCRVLGCEGSAIVDARERAVRSRIGKAPGIPFMGQARTTIQETQNQGLQIDIRVHYVLPCVVQRL